MQLNICEQYLKYNFKKSCKLGRIEKLYEEKGRDIIEKADAKIYKHQHNSLKCSKY